MTKHDSQAFETGTSEQYWTDPEAAGRHTARVRDALARKIGTPRTRPVELYLRGYADETRRLARPGIWRLLSAVRLPWWSISGLFAGARPWRVRSRPVGQRRQKAGRRRGLLGRMVAVSAWAVAGVTMAGALAAYAVWPQVQADLALAEQNLACARLVTSQNAAGDLVDLRVALPNDACQQPDNANGDPLPRPVVTMPYPDTESLMQAAEDLGSIEGAWRVGDTVFGIDPLGFPRKARSVLRAAISDQPDGAGFSSPIISGYETLIQRPGRQRLKDKFVTLLGTMVFTARHLGTDEDRARFIVTTLPSILEKGTGQSGALATHTLFGTSQPSLAQRCITMAATRTPLRIRGAKPPTPEMAYGWATAIGPRAELCVTRRAETPAEAEAALAELKGYCGGLDLCMDPPPMWQVAPQDRQAVALALSQARMAAYIDHGPAFMPWPNAFAGMGQPLVDAMRLGGTAAGGTTSVVPEAQRRVVAAAGALRDRLAEGTVVTLAVVDITTPEPKLLALASNAPSGGFFPAAVATEQGWAFGMPAHALASMNKVPLIAWAVGQGLEVSPAVVAKSTPEIADLITANPESYRMFKQAVGYFGPTSESFAKDSIEGSEQRIAPSQLITLVGALYHGQSAAVSLWDSQPIGTPVDLTALGLDAADRATARKLLATPFGPGGTLAVYAKGATASGCALDLGKSGTAAQGVTNHERGVVVVHRCGDRLLATFALVAHSDGTPITQRDLAPLHKAAVEAVID